MKVFLDEGVPEDLIQHLANHEVRSARQMGLKGVKNGKLLKEVQESGFAVLITNDKNMEAQNSFDHLPFAILVLSACNLPVILPHLAAIAEAVDQALPGTVLRVDCGRFRRSGKRQADRP